MLWQCYDNVMPMLWQCCDNVIPMLWQYYDNVITMLSECYNIVMTLLWHCYDNVMTMFWQCCDNVMTMSPGRSFCFLSPLLFWSWSTGLFTRYTMCRPSCEERLAKSCKEVGSGGLYLPVAHIWYLLPEHQQHCLCRKKLSAWAWFSSKTSPQAKRHRPSLLFTAEIYFSSQIKTMLKYNSVMNNHVQGLNFKQACWGSNVLTFCLDNRSSLAFYFSGYQVECAHPRLQGDHTGQFGLRIVMVYFLKPPSILVLFSLKYAGRWLMDILLY